MQLPNELTETQHAAIVACLRVFAARGRQIRLECEARERAAQVQDVPNAGQTDQRTVVPGESCDER